MENTKKLVAEFEERINIEVRRQEKLNLREEKEFRRAELLGKYTVRIFYR